MSGYLAISIGCTNELGYPPHYHQHTDVPDDRPALERAYQFCSELIELIDERIGPGLDAPAERASR